MSHSYRLANEADVASPALVFYPELIRLNIARVIAMAGAPDRLRPHVKTHKTREIVRLQLAAGVTKHKCATIAEAELLASIGVLDVLIAYPMLGPNLRRLVMLLQKYPNAIFSVLIDHLAGAEALSRAAVETGRSIGFLVDLDVGQHRTGIAVGQPAASLYQQAAELLGLSPQGLHAYDGHNTNLMHSDRVAAAHAAITPVLELRDQLIQTGHSVPRIVAGGTPSFPIYAVMDDIPGFECSPGTYVLHDYGYGSKYADLSGITPAAVLVTRIISRPTVNRMTFDLGTKAVSPDLPLEQRVHLLDFPDATIVGHNEEHLIVESNQAARYAPGAVAYALPGHVCPTVALHREALVAEGGVIRDRWAIIARDRMLTV
jgi:D-serine deaminase-like pyridoxal phosphate-dependent protein